MTGKREVKLHHFLFPLKFPDRIPPPDCDGGYPFFIIGGSDMFFTSADAVRYFMMPEEDDWGDIECLFSFDKIGGSDILIAIG